MMDVLFFAQLREVVTCVLPESHIGKIGHCLQVCLLLQAIAIN